MQGVGGGSFAPGKALTRAQFCKLAVTAMGVTDVSPYASYTIFPDVKHSHWAAPYINAAVRHPELKEKSIIRGYADGSFGPDKIVSYGEVCTMLLRMLGYKEEDVGPFWPADYIAQAQAIGLTDGVTIADARAAVKRGDAAVLLLNALNTDKKGEEGSTLLDKVASSTVKDCILLETGKTHSGLAADAALFYEDGVVDAESPRKTTGTLDSSMIGVYGTIVIGKGSSKVAVGVIPNGNKTEAYEVVNAAADRIVTTNGTLRPDRKTKLYISRDHVMNEYENAWANLQSGDTLTLYYNEYGVLQLMAAVIHELWMGSDASAMIMPGSLSLDVPNVRDELIRYLPEGWNSIVNTEIDGKNSVPYQKDQSNQRYGRIMASRRVARTIMLGSAPTVRSQAVRGIEASRIRLGVVQPGENIADFNDALNTLRGSLAYLYTNTNGDRYWFDTRPTLRKTAQDRATQVAEADVIEEIESRLKKLRREEPFAGLHVCPASSLDVPDEQAAWLVILRTEDTHRANAGASAAITAAENILNNHGSKPRTYRNMLAFVAPDQEAMLSLRQAVRDFRAWRSIQDDKETLNLDAAQNKEVDANLHRCNDTVEARIKGTYCWLLTPEIDCFVDMKTIQWDASRISGGTDSIVAKASRKMQQSETLITKWAPALLLMELNNVLWKDTDCIQIKKLWEYLCTYCYLPRLAKYSVLEDAIRTGLNSQEYFALAAGYTGDRYVELRYNQFVDCINTSDLLVKLDPARKQLLAEKSAPAVVVQPTQTAQGGEQPTLFNLPPDAPIDPTVILHQPPTAQPAAVPAPPKNTRFYMTAELDTTRINRDVQRLVEEVITHLLSADGCKVSVTLDVTADAPDGLSTPIVRTVMENCKTLKVKDFGVDE